jgi:ribosomal protein S13
VRAELKEKLKMGSLDLEGLFALAANNEMVGKMKVVAVLESLPGVGKVKARRTMDDIGISESRRLRGLGDQQREKLLATFPS